MVFRIRKRIWLILLAVALLILAVWVIASFKKTPHHVSLLGGTLHTSALYVSSSKEVWNQDELKTMYERFRRPSNQSALPNQFSFQDFEKEGNQQPLITTVFQNPEDVIKAYFGILQSASNMTGYSGGCGSIGNAFAPYQYAYELFTPEAQKEISLPDFTKSFQGIGYLTLLKMYPAYIPPGTSPGIRYYMFETEVITGASEKDPEAYQRGGSAFAYNYGLLTVKNDKKSGWKIESIDCFSEDFLCAPEHGWSYLSNYVVQFVYHDWYQLIDKIEKTVQNGNIVSVYASGKAGEYRFDFVRLTNGYDILLHENLCINGKWTETNILKPEHQSFKLSILNSNLDHN